MKLGWLRGKLIWRVERDPIFPHMINVYDIFGRKLMVFESGRNGGAYGGDSNHWEDDA